MSSVSESDHPPMAGWHDKLAFLEIDEATRSRLSTFLPILDEKLPELLDAFYGHMTKWPGLNKTIGDPGNIPRLNEAQSAHWRHLFSGRFDDAYRVQVHRVGLAHMSAPLQETRNRADAASADG